MRSRPGRASLGRTVALLVVLVVSLPWVGAAPAPAPAQEPKKVPTAAVVRLPFPQDDGSLTPYTTQVGYQLMTLVYDTLLWRDDEGVPQPWLATSVDVAPDGRRVTIHLDERARWHDGRPVTAADVAFTFRFLTERPHPRFTGQLRAVERVEVPNPATVVVHLRHPSPGFSNQPLADVPILPAHLWQKLPRHELAPAGLPVGSGPYRLVEHIENQRYRFEAFPGYFRGPPAVATIEVPIIRTYDETIRAFERREVDMIPVSLTATSRTELEGLATRVREGPSYGGTVLMFNLRHPPFDRVEVRRALAGALDVANIARGVGASTPANRGYLHPSSTWAPSETLAAGGGRAAPAGTGAPGSGAPAGLRALGLAPIEVLVADNDPLKTEAARQVVLALQRAGAQAAVKTAPYPEVSTAVGETGGEPSFSTALWSAPPLASHDPDFLPVLFGSDPRQAVLNYSGYRSAGFDAAAAAVASTVDRQARRAAVAEELRVLAGDAPVVPLFFATGTFAYRPGVYDGWRFVKGTGLLDKRSFTDPFSPRPVKAAPAAPAGAEPPSGDGISPIGWMALAVAGVAVVLGTGALLRGRR